MHRLRVLIDHKLSIEDNRMAFNIQIAILQAFRSYCFIPLLNAVRFEIGSNTQFLKLFFETKVNQLIAKKRIFLEIVEFHILDTFFGRATL